MNNEIKQFERYLNLQGYSPKCRYPYLVKQFLQNNSLTKENIENYILNLKNKTTTGHINNIIKALKVYCKFKNINIELPPIQKTILKIPDSITIEYLEDEVIPLAELFFEKRILQVKAILYFMFYTGVRKGEMLYIHRKDFDLNKNRVKIYAPKTKNERIVIFPEKVKGIFLDYFNSEKEKNNAFNLTQTTVSNIFKTLKPHLKDCNFRPHLFRHSALTMLAKGNMNILYIQKLAGHKSIESTKRYIQCKIDDIQDIYNNLTKDK